MISAAADQDDSSRVPVPPQRAIRWDRRQRLAGFGVVSAIMAAVCWSLVRAGVSVTRGDLASRGQLIDVPFLERDPIGSVWYLHTQPPLYNLVIGAVLRWSPLPPLGTIFVLYLAALCGAALLLTDVLARWNVRPWIAGTISGIAFASPNLLATINIVSYEVPVTFLLVLVLWCFQRYLQAPGWGPLLGLSAAVTGLVLTRSLFHPAFALVVIGLAVVARRATWRQATAALAIPVVLAGGWMLKNQVLFGTPTMSSWLGFNLQRGVVATLPRDEVERAVEEGDATDLALRRPWLALDEYPGTGSCTPEHDHAAVDRAQKHRVGLYPYPNLNDECFLPLYAESQANAAALVRRDPLDYLSTRRQVLLSSFATGPIGGGRGHVMGTGKVAPTRTWMDQTLGRAMLPVHVGLDLSGWNLPIAGVDALEIEVSPVIALLALGLAVRAGLALVRLARSGWRDRRSTWEVGELLWLLTGGYLLAIVVVGDLIEFGENGRFRTPLDPLLIALPLGALARLASERRGEASDRHGADNLRYVK